MNETPNNFPPDRWCNDEIAVHVESWQSLPPKPLPEKVRAQLLEERARWAKLAREDPQFREELKRHFIHLTPEELGETERPASGNAETTPP